MPQIEVEAGGSPEVPPKQWGLGRNSAADLQLLLNTGVIQPNTPQYHAAPHGVPEGRGYD
jgi:hypothetical protein